jgi:hypothetical protein
LGFIEYRQKNYRRAIDYLRTNVASDDNFAQLARLYAGLAMGALGFPAQARAEVEEALRVQPMSPLVLPARRFGEELARAVARERRLSGELRFGLFYDSNVAVVPDASSDLVATVLREDQAQPHSPGELGSLNLAYTWLKGFDWEGTVAYRFLQTYNNQLPDFNVQNHTPTVGIAYRGSIADKLIHGPPMLEDDLRRLSQIVAEEGDDLLRLDLLGDAGKAANVREEDGNVSPPPEQSEPFPILQDLIHHVSRDISAEDRSQAQALPLLTEIVI